MQEERRRHTRYDRIDLQLDVARTGIKGILSINPSTECMDFSLTGVRFGSNQQFKIDDKLLMDVRTGDIALDDLHGRVVDSIAQEDGTWCTCVRFCFEDKAMQRPEISHALLQIEDRLRIAQEFPA